MRARPLISLLTVAVLGVTGLSACGADTAALTDLLDKLPALDPPAAVQVNVSALRDALGVGDISFTAALSDSSPDAQRFGNTVSVALPVLRSPTRSPLLDALDTSQITAMAANTTTGARRGVTLIATGQSFDEVAEALVKAGFTRTGDLLRAPAGAKPVEASAIAGGNGLIAVGQDLDAVRVAVNGTGGGVRGQVRDLITVDGALAGIALQSTFECPRVVSVTDSGDRKAVLTVVDPNARPSRFIADGGVYFRSFTYTQPKVKDGQLTVDISYPEQTTYPVPVQMLAGESPLEAIYNCER